MKAGGWHSKPSIDNGLANMLGNLNLGPQSLEAGRSAPEESELSTAFQSAACISASDLIYYSDGEEEVRSPLPKERQSLADEFHSPDSERETHTGPEPDRSNSRMSGSIRGSSPPSQPNKSTFQLNKTSLAAVPFKSAQSRTNAFDPAVGPSPAPPVKAGRQRLVKVSELPKPILKPESQPPSVRPAAVRNHAIRQERSFVDLSDSEDEGEGDGREFEAPLREDAGCLKLGDGKCILRGALAKGLYPHQRQGLEWLWSLHEKEGGGGILGDDMVRALGLIYLLSSYFFCGNFTIILTSFLSSHSFCFCHSPQTSVMPLNYPWEIVEHKVSWLAFLYNQGTETISLCCSLTLIMMAQNYAFHIFTQTAYCFPQNSPFNQGCKGSSLLYLTLKMSQSTSHLFLLMLWGFVLVVVLF